jgi:hypothetical protein
LAVVCGEANMLNTALCCVAEWRTKLTTEPNKMGEPARVKSLLAHLLKATGPGIADCRSSNSTRWQQLGLLPQPIEAASG